MATRAEIEKKLEDWLVERLRQEKMGRRMFRAVKTTTLAPGERFDFRYVLSMHFSAYRLFRSLIDEIPERRKKK